MITITPSEGVTVYAIPTDIPDTLEVMVYWNRASGLAYLPNAHEGFFTGRHDGVESLLDRAMRHRDGEMPMHHRGLCRGDGTPLLSRWVRHEEPIRYTLGHEWQTLQWGRVPLAFLTQAEGLFFTMSKQFNAIQLKAREWSEARIEILLPLIAEGWGVPDAMRDGGME